MRCFGQLRGFPDFRLCDGVKEVISMVELLRGGSLGCALCGTTTATGSCHFPVVLRSRRGFLWRRRGVGEVGDVRTPKLRCDGPQACKKSKADGGSRGGSGTGLKVGSGSASRRRRCKLFRTVDESVGGGDVETVVHSACIDARRVTAAAQNLEERARSDVAILARGILRLDMRARQDVALIGSSFMKLDARAREDTEKLDFQAREKVKRLRRIAVGLQETARMEAAEHWNDGALDADLRLADLRARRRAMEDAYASVQAVKSVQSSLVNIWRLREVELRPNRKSGSKLTKDISLGDASYSTGSVALDRLLELEESYLSLTSLLLSEADGIDCTDPDELELVVATLLDMDEVAGGSGASFLAECATSPDVATRQALADALADAPSLWTLGNAGMGALQRLAKDSDPTIAAAAAKAIEDLTQQWRVEDRSSFFFPRTDPPLPDNSEPVDESGDI